MEYVGEVIDGKEFRRRAKEYSKDKNRHYYFMALKSNTIIDATMKGNHSRFINHSCDPNAETQKVRIGSWFSLNAYKRPLTMLSFPVDCEWRTSHWLLHEALRYRQWGNYLRLPVPKLRVS